MYCISAPASSPIISCIYLSSHPSRCSSHTALASSNVPNVTSLLGRIFPQPFTWLTLCTHSNASFSKRPSLTTPNNGGPLSLASLSLYSFFTLHRTWQYPFYYSVFSNGLLPSWECKLYGGRDFAGFTQYCVFSTKTTLNKE